MLCPIALYRWRNWGLVRLRKFPKVTQSMWHSKDSNSGLSDSRAQSLSHCFSPFLVEITLLSLKSYRILFSPQCKWSCILNFLSHFPSYTPIQNFHLKLLLSKTEPPFLSKYDLPTVPTIGSTISSTTHAWKLHSIFFPVLLKYNR